MLVDDRLQHQPQQFGIDIQPEGCGGVHFLDRARAVCVKEREGVVWVERAVGSLAHCDLHPGEDLACGEREDRVVVVVDGRSIGFQFAVKGVGGRQGVLVVLEGERDLCRCV